MPTKPHYVSVVGTVAPPPVPFASRFNKGGAPDSFEVDFLPCPAGNPPGASVAYDREGSHLRTIGGCIGVPPPHTPFSLAWTANVVTFDNAYSATKPSLFAASSNAIYRIPTYYPGSPMWNGWALLAPLPHAVVPSDHKLVSTDSPPVTFYGLPMIGFMANSYYNGAVPNPSGGATLLSAYGATSPHKGKSRIQ